MTLELSYLVTSSSLRSMRRNKVWNQSSMSPLIEYLFFNRCFQVAGFDSLFTITIPKYLRLPIPLSKSSTYGRKSVSSSGSKRLSCLTRSCLLKQDRICIKSEIRDANIRGAGDISLRTKNCRFALASGRDEHFSSSFPVICVLLKC
jgi:hypothetical protein